MTGTAGISANAQMVENAWTRAQIDLKTVAFTKNGEFIQRLPNSPNELFWREKQSGQWPSYNPPFALASLAKALYRRQFQTNNPASWPQSPVTMKKPRCVATAGFQFSTFS
jgi:hypothetical protein